MELAFGGVGAFWRGPEAALLARIRRWNRGFAGGGFGGSPAGRRRSSKGWATHSAAHQRPGRRGSGLTKGIIGLCNHGQPRKPDDWGALRALGLWAPAASWTTSNRPERGAKRVAIEGHSPLWQSGVSRYGV